MNHGIVTPHNIVAHVQARRKRTFWLAEWSWWWTLVGHNGEIVCASETYSSVDARDHTARLVSIQLRVPYLLDPLQTKTGA